MDQATLLRELADLQESYDWACGEVSQLQGLVIQLKGQQRARIQELEDKLANADMIRRYLRGENLRLTENKTPTYGCLMKSAREAHERLTALGIGKEDCRLPERLDYLIEEIRKMPG